MDISLSFVPPAPLSLKKKKKKSPRQITYEDLKRLYNKSTEYNVFVDAIIYHYSLLLSYSELHIFDF